MNRNNDMLIALREEIAGAAANMKKCQGAYKGFKAFRENPQGLAFSAALLHEAAGALREAAEHLAAMAENLQDAYSVMPEQLDLHDVGMNGR